MSYPQYPRINTGLSAVRFNDISRSNYEYPVRVEYTEKMLLVYAEGYGSMPSTYMITKKMIPELLESIDKYFEWEKLAVERNETITKRIRSIDYHLTSLVVDFHSANARTHLFTLGFIMKPSSVYDLCLTKENVVIFRKLISDYMNDAIQTEKTDSIYK